MKHVLGLALAALMTIHGPATAADESQYDPAKVSESLKAIRKQFTAFQEEMKDIIAKDKGTDKVCTVVFQIIPNSR